MYGGSVVGATPTESSISEYPAPARPAPITSRPTSIDGSATDQIRPSVAPAKGCSQPASRCPPSEAGPNNTGVLEKGHATISHYTPDCSGLRKAEEDGQN